jgi:hypothetical protein
MSEGQNSKYLQKVKKAVRKKVVLHGISFPY